MRVGWKARSSEKRGKFGAGKGEKGERDWAKGEVKEMSNFGGRSICVRVCEVESTQK